MTTRQEVEAKLVTLGFTKDRYGNYKRPYHQVKKHTGDYIIGEVRVKIQLRSARYEVKQSDGSWFNKASDYYCNMGLGEDYLIIDKVRLKPIAGIAELAEKKSAEIKEFNKIYIQNGYLHRLDYLKSISKENNVPVENVIAVANLLGPEEDFDGLLSSIGVI